jgi:hypothetical protein
MLVGDRVSGLDFMIEHMLFQTRYAGHLVDDITIFGTDHSGTDRLIDYQSKRTIAAMPNDKDFAETIAISPHAIRDKGDQRPVDDYHYALDADRAPPRLGRSADSEQLKRISQDTSR